MDWWYVERSDRRDGFLIPMAKGFWKSKDEKSAALAGVTSAVLLLLVL